MGFHLEIPMLTHLLTLMGFLIQTLTETHWDFLKVILMQKVLNSGFLMAILMEIPVHKVQVYQCRKGNTSIESITKECKQGISRP